jgi:arylsulfatase A-like enzyme/sucrose-6-phosphate hydrolase SacC (GH32 family)
MKKASNNPTSTTHLRRPMRSLVLLALSTLCGAAAMAQTPAKPNLVVILVDDLGYGDLGCYGSKLNKTPHIDRMASEGVRFTDFYMGASICTPSRAAFMTGCYPKRVGLAAGVLVAGDARGLNPEEFNIARLAKSEGYATALVGKWHLGDQLPFFPTRQGFDSFFGLPYSNDLVKSKPSPGRPYPPLPLIENETVIEQEPDQSTLTDRYTERAVAFIRQQKDRPFFLFMSHMDVHEILHPPQRFKVRSKNGDFGAAVEHVDWSTGEILAALKQEGLERNTLVILTSDNGSNWLRRDRTNHPLKAGKGTTYEGGFRVPCLMKWPGRLPAGTQCKELTTVMDILPTFAHLLGAKLDGHPKIDGKNILPLMENPAEAKSPHETFLYYQGDALEAIRSGRWKLFVAPHTVKRIRKNPAPGQSSFESVKEPALQLYDLETDVGETKDVAAQHPEVEKELTALADGAVADLGDVRRGVAGSGCRPEGVIKEPAPITRLGKLTADDASKSQTPRSDLVLGAFDGADLGGWTATGDAFPAKPFQPGANASFTSFEGAGIVWSGRGGYTGKGTLVSPEFEIQRGFINFLIAGHRDIASQIGAELLVDGRVVRAAGATEGHSASSLHWRTWEVGEWAGKRAQIRVNDATELGALAVDHFVQSDARKGVPSDATTLIQETHRPQFHYTARAGWLNDANGLLHYRGQWHLFHQHRPPGGLLSVWGHAVSPDLLHWEHRPVALPGEGESAIYSGSGLVDGENHSGLKQGADSPLLFFYTLRPPGAVSVNDGKGDKTTQGMAYSLDGGQTFQRFAGNPILRTKDFRDRDPKVFWHAPSRAWIMVLSLSRNNADRENATYGLFRAEDLKSWKLVQEIGPGAWYWECPDMFELPIDGDAARTKWLLLNGSGDYILGSFDGHRFTPERGIIKTRWGGAYYGVQSFENGPGGRRIQIGWMSTGKARLANAYPGMPFNQQMSFPREWTLRTTPAGPRIFSKPVAEIEKLYTKTHDLKPRTLAPGDNALAGITHDLLDIDCEIALQDAAQVNLNLRGERILYDVKAKELTAFGSSVPLAPVDGKLALRILLDRTSIELFGNQGEVTHSGVFFPDPANRKLMLTAQGAPAHIDRLAVRELKSIWPEHSTAAAVTKKEPK